MQRAKTTKPKTVRISRRDVVAQSERSSRVELRLHQAVQQQEENKGGEEEVEKENAAAVEEDNTGGGEELGNQGKENDSEEDEESESEEGIVEEGEEEEVLQRNCRGRPITASSRDTVPINQSITYRRKRWA